MKNEVKEYIIHVQERIESGNIDRGFEREMLTRIGFYQHERLVHLIVTMTFAVMTVISFFMLITAPSLSPLLLSLLFLSLVIPYIYHYYFLENSVQKLYRLYYEVQQRLSSDGEASYNGE